MAVTTRDRSIYNLYDRLLLVCKWLKIDMAEFNFEFTPDQLKGFERLSNTKSMVDYYKDHENDEAKPLKREKLTSDNTKPWHKPKSEKDAKFLKSFGNSFQTEADVDIENLDEVIEQPEDTVQISGMDFAVEILKQNLVVPSNFLLLFLIAGALSAIPVIVILITKKPEEPIFQNENHKLAYFLGIFPMIALKFANLILSILLRSFYIQKRRYKQAIMSCLDEQLKERYVEETYAELPSIPLNNPNNLVSAMTLTTLMMDLHSTNMRRGGIFIATTFIVTSIQFLYCCLEVVILKKPIETVGSPIYIAYTILDFLVICVILLTTLFEGAEANYVDHEFKQWIWKLTNRITLIKSQAQKGQIFKKDGRYDLVKTNKKTGKKISSRTKQEVDIS